MNRIKIKKQRILQITSSTIVFFVIVFLICTIHTGFSKKNTPNYKNDDKRAVLNQTGNILVIGNNEFFVELAKTETDRERGLGGRDGLKDNSGMLFVFEPPRPVGFWMKDMKFPIDIVWIDENMMVSGFVQNAEPDSYPQVYGSGSAVSYVLEIGAGRVLSDNIKIGDKANFKFQNGNH